MRSEFLDECLVDPAGKSQSQRRRARRKVVVAAATLEAAAILSLALYPLFTPAKLRPQLVNAPIPVGFGAPEVNHHAASSPHTRLSRHVLFSPPRVPTHIYRLPVAEQSSEAPSSAENFDSGLPPGISNNPGGFGSGPAPIERPRSAAPVRIVRRDEKFQEGQLIRRVVPQYPQIARVARISGTVELLVLIGQDGRVKSVEVLSGNPMLAASARAGVEQWLYRPAILNGHAVEVETRVTVRFVLNE